MCSLYWILKKCIEQPIFSLVLNSLDITWLYVSLFFSVSSDFLHIPNMPRLGINLSLVGNPRD